MAEGDQANSNFGGTIEEPLSSIVDQGRREGESGSRWSINSLATLQLPGTLNGTIVFPSAGVIVAILGGLMITSLLFEFLTNALFRFLKRRKISKRLLLAAYKELMILGFISFFAFLSQNVFFSEIPDDINNFVELIHYELAITGLLYMTTIVLSMFCNSFFGRHFTQFETQLSISPATAFASEKRKGLLARAWKVFDTEEYYHARKGFLRQNKLLKSEFDFAEYLKAGMNNVIIHILPLDWAVWSILLLDVVVILVAQKFVQSTGELLTSLVYASSSWIILCFSILFTHKLKSVLRDIVQESQSRRRQHSSPSSSSASFPSTSTSLPHSSQVPILRHTEPWGTTSNNVSSPATARRLADNERLPFDSSLKNFNSPPFSSPTSTSPSELVSFSPPPISTSFDSTSPSEENHSSYSSFESLSQLRRHQEQSSTRTNQNMAVTEQDRSSRNVASPFSSPPSMRRATSLRSARGESRDAGSKDDSSTLSFLPMPALPGSGYTSFPSADEDGGDFLTYHHHRGGMGGGLTGLAVGGGGGGSDGNIVGVGGDRGEAGGGGVTNTHHHSASTSPRPFSFHQGRGEFDFNSEMSCGRYLLYRVQRWFGCYQYYMEIPPQEEQMFWFSNAAWLLKATRVLVLSQVVSAAILSRMAITWWTTVGPALVLFAALPAPLTLFFFLRYLLPLYPLTAYSLPTLPSKRLMKRHMKKNRIGPFSFASDPLSREANARREREQEQEQEQRFLEMTSSSPSSRDEVY